MAATDGYAVIRNAIPEALAHQAAASIPGKLRVRAVYASSTEYDPRNHDDDAQSCGSAERICDHFVKHGDKTDVLRLLNRASGEKLVLTSAGVFHEPKVISTETRHGRRETVYVTIAVSDLSAENGWFTFLKGSHIISPPFDNCAQVNLRMDAGDAVVWSGDLRYKHSSGSGGKFVTLAYQ